MNRMKSLGTMGLMLLFVVACGRTQEPAAYPLAESGPYHVGMRTVRYVDDSRGGRQVSVTVWYPAVGPGDPSSTDAARDAEPDRSGEPYPLILSSTTMANTLAPYVVSHGFTWASVDGINTYMALYEGAIDQPLDILFVDGAGSLAPNMSLELTPSVRALE